MAGSYIHGGQPGFVHTLAGVSLCVDSLDITINRNVIDTRTNCGNEQTPGEVSTEVSDGGPLGFGAGSDEATKYAHITGTADAAWTSRPSSAIVGAGNPQLSGNLLATQFKMSLSPTGNVTQATSYKLTDTTGYPARATS